MLVRLWGKRTLLTLLVGVCFITTTIGNSMDSLQKSKITTGI